MNKSSERSSSGYRTTSNYQTNNNSTSLSRIQGSDKKKLSVDKYNTTVSIGLLANDL